MVPAESSHQDEDASDAILSIAEEIRILSIVVSKAARRDLEQRLAEAGVGIGALPFAVLRVLKHQAMTMSEISRAMHMAPASLVSAIDALEGAGLVIRGKDPLDRRRTPLSLTEQGSALLKRIPVTTHQDELVRSLAALGDEQAQHLLSFLRYLVHHMDDGPEIIQRVMMRVWGTTKQEPETPPQDEA